jgi:hypothetical protein
MPEVAWTDSARRDFPVDSVAFVLLPSGYVFRGKYMMIQGKKTDTEA